MDINVSDIYPFTYPNEQIQFKMSMPPKTDSQILISLEGNIGSGKSTILNLIRENFPQLLILDQPLVEWQGLGDQRDINLLELYYKDPIRWGFTFQIFTFMTRLKKWSEYSKQKDHVIRISQRSLLSDRHIFASLMHETGILTATQHQIYEQMFNSLTKNYNIIEPKAIIYVSCPPKICCARIAKRSREGEQTIPFEYIDALHQKHQAWTKEFQGRILIIDNQKPIQKQSIVEQVSQWLSSIKNQS